MTSPRGEWRGVWHRPREKNAEEIDAVVRRVAGGNLNAIFLETFWNGKTIYPSDLTEERPEFEGFDVLGAYVEAGQKFGVQIHSWVHTFFLGYQVPSKGIDDVPRKLEEHPEWRLVHRNGSTVSSLEPGYIWACPANPAVQEFVGSIYREIARKYAVAGIQHDYIRFPTSGTADENSCYCGYCRAAVKLELGFDLLTVAADDSIRHKQWREWKEARISKFAREMSGSFPNKLLSAAVFPDIQMTRKDKMQNWVSWTAGPLIGLLSPMCYTSSTSEVENGLREMRRLSREVPIAAGLAPFMGLRTQELLEQIEVARSCGSNGVIFFELTTLTDLSMAAFAHGPFRNRTKPPFSP